MKFRRNLNSIYSELHIKPNLFGPEKYQYLCVYKYIMKLPIKS